jgi:hypothetical protein
MLPFEAGTGGAIDLEFFDTPMLRVPSSRGEFDYTQGTIPNVDRKWIRVLNTFGEARLALDPPGISCHSLTVAVQ